jgi:hypothetical protein
VPPQETIHLTSLRKPRISQNRPYTSNPSSLICCLLPLVNIFTHIGLHHHRGWLVSMVYSYCSHLEHRASVKRFVSLQFLTLRHSVGLLGGVISPSQSRYLTQTSISRVGFEPTIPAFEIAKIVHALNRAATVIGASPSCWNQNLSASQLEAATTEQFPEKHNAFVQSACGAAERGPRRCPLRFQPNNLKADLLPKFAGNMNSFPCSGATTVDPEHTL